MEEFAGWLTNNWQETLIGFMVLEKVVKLSPGPWDDILFSGLKFIINSIKDKKEKP